MSAIAGIYFLDGRPVDRADLERMVASVAHRGPDGADLWNDGPVGLGHRMMWTTPESLHEKFPLPNKNGNVVLTADARIDNRDELIADLGITGRLRREIGDGELILGAYERWGERCPEKLIGDFAFAIWDRRKRVLFCARDHFGIKPFYYYCFDDVFVFASEIKALLCLPEVPRRLNEVRVADYLVPMLEDKRITLYQEILRLPPGHSLTIGREEARERTYWSPGPTSEVRFRSDAEYAGAFRDIFAEAVRCRLRSAGPVGSTLSGGLDSSSVACVARDILARDGGRRLHTFSGVYDDVPECDERPYINAVLDQGGMEPHFVHPDQLSPLTDWEGTPWREDEPLRNPQMALSWLVCQAAREQNVRVLLGGLGGDDVVSHGVALLTDLARAGRWMTFMSEASGLAKRFNRPLWRIIRAWGIVPFLPEPARQAWRTLRGRNDPVRSFDALIRADFARRIGLAERVAAFESEQSKPARTSREKHWLGLTSGLFQSSLGMADRTAALFGIEPRHPFFDRRLMEFCLALPAEQKMRQGWTRVIVRHALANILPEAVRWRGGKANLGPSFNRGMLTADRGVLDDVILREPGRIAEYVDMVALRQVYQRYLSYANNADGYTLWRVAIIALWLRRTGATPEAAEAPNR